MRSGLYGKPWKHKDEKEIYSVIKMLRVYWGRQIAFNKIITRIMRFKTVISRENLIQVLLQLKK